ncbi:hypothetical protein FB561_7532 [Kribbella amoyensis]|uniref:Lipoprotein antigen n=1 Tax=Kribbella amoyensis TaxID=996641 RepID=A0A561B0Z9_9ACTN|nr:hypothetical protein [Kribbella amoyensis]TWD72540.1 hypothetical protein FB561_7532 [Kribbella amoyensis]
MSIRRLTLAGAAALLALLLLGCEPTTSTGGRPSTKPTTGKANGKANGKATAKTTTAQSQATVRITASDGVCWKAKVGRESRAGCGSSTLQAKDSRGIYRITLNKTKGAGELSVVLVVSGRSVDRGSVTSDAGLVSMTYTNQSSR